MKDIDVDLHIVRLPPDLAGDPAPGTVWVVKLVGDKWSADLFVNGEDGGRGFSTTHRHMVDEAMALLGLVRHDPRPSDNPDVVEVWS